MDCFDTIEIDLTGLLTEYENTDICLFGDFNLGTSNLDDTPLVNEDELAISILLLICLIKTMVKIVFLCQIGLVVMQS